MIKVDVLIQLTVVARAFTNRWGSKTKLKNLFQGLQTFRNGETKKLVRNARSKKRQAAWDLTFSAPKSVSIRWALDEKLRSKIQYAHTQAVIKAIDFLESKLAFTRRGHGGKIREQVRIVAATFEHGTSREVDPQLHTHVVIPNIGLREDGTTGSILSRPFYQFA